MAPKKKTSKSKAEKPKTMATSQEQIATSSRPRGVRIKHIAHKPLPSNVPESSSASRKRKAPPAKKPAQKQKKGRKEPIIPDEESEEKSESGDGSEGSEEDHAEEETYAWDRYEFLDNDRVDFFNTVVLGEQILVEKKVDFASLVEVGMDLSPIVPEKLQQFLGFDDPHYPRLVRLFYANLGVETRRLGKKEEVTAVTSFVKGVDLRITQKTIAGLTNLEAAGFDKVEKDAPIPEGINLGDFSAEQLAQVPTFEKLIGTRLKAIPRLLHMIIANNILPRYGSKDSVTKGEQLIMWHLLNRKPLNFPSIILKNIARIGLTMGEDGYEKRSNHVHLPYARLISKLLKEQSVVVDGEKVANIKEKEIMNNKYLVNCNIVKSRLHGWILQKYVQPPDEIIWGDKDEDRTVKPPATQPRRSQYVGASSNISAELEKKVASLLEMQRLMMETLKENQAELKANVAELKLLRAEVAELKEKLDDRSDVPDTPPEAFFFPPKTSAAGGGMTSLGATTHTDATKTMEEKGAPAQEPNASTKNDASTDGNAAFEAAGNVPGMKWIPGFYIDPKLFPRCDTQSWMLTENYSVSQNVPLSAGQAGGNEMDASAEGAKKMEKEKAVNEEETQEP